MIAFLKLLPLNFISQWTGILVRIRLPASVSRVMNSLFVKLFQIDMNEAEKSLDEYRTIEDVFTRKLKSGARVSRSEVVSPADGALVRTEQASEEQAVQIKGINYDLAELVYGLRSEKPYQHQLAWYSTIYLAPHNYHRVHSPCSARLKGVRYIPGKLFPVNKPAVRFIPQLFCENERVVFELICEKSQGRVDVVMVGALNVGRIVSPYLDDFASNATFNRRGFYQTKSIDISVGDELGTFMLGSTVVLVFDKAFADYYDLQTIQTSCTVQCGESLLRGSDAKK